MKNQKIFSLSLILVLSLSMIGISTSSALASISLNRGSEIAYNHSPMQIQAVNPDDLSFETTSLPTLDGWWTDLVDTETVANDGSGVYVAVLDTGLLPGWETTFSQATIRDDLGIGFSHDITFNSVTGGIDISPVKVVGFETELASGHGTHVTSTVVGFNFLDTAWINGVAPNAQIIPVRVLDAWDVAVPGGSIQLSGGTDAMIASGIYYIAQLAATLDGPVVINMSLGGANPQPAIRQAIQYAISQDVIIVASAGNEGSAGMGYPGAFPEVISTAAVGWTESILGGFTSDAPETLNSADSLGNNHQLFLAPFSSVPNMDLGQKHKDLDVAAPGVYVVGPYKSAFADNTGFYYLSGTSMSAPHVAGIAALVLQSYPDLGQASMESILKLASRGMPLPADGAFALTFGGLAFFDWDGGDYGAGFITAPNALTTAAIFA